MVSDIDILTEITTHYLGSHDFNGLPIGRLCEKLGVTWEEIQGKVAQLINQELVGAIFSDVEINTHILRTGFEPKENQIAKLPDSDFYHTCLYPRPSHLKKVVEQEKYIQTPYILEMALGSPQLSFRSFDLSILEYYRNDPRYRYQNDDVNGSISISDEYYEADDMLERDQILLQTFGFSYDENLNRAVAVFLRYLADLSPEHQQVWKARELYGDYKLHPDYFRNTILGEWGERVPIFDAFIAEINIINKMSAAMGRPPLFRSNYGEYREDKPQKFSFLVRPTLEEFNSFVLLLDKMLSDDINKKFFRKEVSYEIEIQRKDGKILVQNKGTLQILDDWIRQYYQTDDWEPWENAIAAFKAVRKARQNPAHSVNENVFDQKYFRDQRKIIVDAYSGVRILRMMLQNHPLVREAKIEIPDWLREGRIWTQ